MMTFLGKYTGLSITQFWGQNSAPFPMPKNMLFPNSKQKIPMSKKNKYFFWFFTFISYNINTEHIVTYLHFTE